MKNDVGSDEAEIEIKSTALNFHDLNGRYRLAC